MAWHCGNDADKAGVPVKQLRVAHPLFEPRVVSSVARGLDCRRESAPSRPALPSKYRG
jgi:hypothetical protein